MPDIGDDEIVWRRIPPSWWIEKDGIWRLSSASFLERDPGGAVSVHRAILTSITAVWKCASPQHGIVALRARVPRDHGYEVLPDPLPDDESHALLIPPADFGQRKERKASTAFGKECEWIVPVDPNRTNFAF